MQSVCELSHSHQGQRLRLVLFSGEIAEVEIIEVAQPNKYDKTPQKLGRSLRSDLGQPTTSNS